MKEKNDKLGSWKRAVTTADGTWQTRGWHSKNATFTIRNYLTGALLYYHHLCQKGSDKVIQQPLYDGSSFSNVANCHTMMLVGEMWTHTAS